MTVPNFISFALPYAIAAYNQYGVNPIVTMAQAAIESAWGEKALGNNYFGIKATASWTGKTQNFLTTEEVNGERISVTLTFRAYDTPLESFLDYGAVISQNSRYAAAMNYPGYYQTEEYVQAIVNGGYATAGSYQTLCNSVVSSIKKYLSASELESQKKNLTTSINSSSPVLMIGAELIIGLAMYKYNS